MSHLLSGSPIYLFIFFLLLPSRAPNAKTKNGHQQGGVIDGADICGYTSQVLSNISFLSAEARRLPFLTVSTGPSLARGAGTPFTPSLLSLNSNPNPARPVCPPLFTPLLARMHFDVYLQRERGQLH